MRRTRGSERTTNAWRLACATWLIVAGAAAGADPPPASSKTVDFARDVLPILRERCFRCHAGSEAESGVRLDSRPALLGETDGRPLAEPGRGGTSRLVRLVAGLEPKLRMPPDGEGERLSAEQIGVLRAWIDQGVKWDERASPPPRPGSEHWAFQPVRRPAIPAPARRTWPLGPVDAFVADRHERLGLAPAPPADVATFLRRLSLVLTGLPPAPDEGTHEEGEAPDAWSRRADRMLASVAYGERWGRHWLDVARWAESEGYESNHVRPYAWRYRDWVVRSFLRDQPYDEFLRDQLAGDERPEGGDEALVATGFLAAARLSSNEEDKALQRGAVLVDVVNAVGAGVLGLTFACAQCHNHKFDPLTQRDYYRLLAFFVSGQPANLTLDDPVGRARYEAALPAEYRPAKELRLAIESRARRAALDERRAKFSAATRAALDKSESERDADERELARQAELELQLLPGQIEQAIPAEDRPLHDALKKKLAELEKRLPDPPQTWGFYSPRTAARAVEVLPMKGFYPLAFEPDELRRANAYLLVRGDVHRRGPALRPGVPEVFETTTRAASIDFASSARSRLVDWLVSPDHPLTARVWANRIWQHHVGRGIVESSGDFGVKGTPPTHPELLDFLASSLRSDGWSAKRLHRHVVLSATFRQASVVEPAARAADPEGRELTRWTPRRLEAEAVRDSLLAAAGRLDRTAFGPSATDARAPRRALYLQQLRDRPPETQRLFDGPSANESCSRRHVSTVPLQPLFLLNHPLVLDAARELARRLEAAAGDDASRVELAFRWTLGREPDDEERRAARGFLAGGDAPQSGAAGSAARRLVPFCQTLLNLSEFLYVE